MSFIRKTNIATTAVIAFLSVVSGLYFLSFVGAVLLLADFFQHRAEKSLMESEREC